MGFTVRFVHRVAAACLSIGVAGGCGGAKPEVATLRLEDVPPELMKIAAEKLPGVKFDTAFKKPSGTIEIRGTQKNGKIRDIDIRPDGTVEEVD